MRHIENEYREWGEEYDALQILGDIEDAPAVDALEVVRCRDCKWYFENEDYETLNAIPFCDHPEGGGVTRGKHWYCGDGERREDGKIR